MIFRFVAALGTGGERAIGAALLSETWPKAWRPWIAAVIQTGVNIGVLCGALVVGLLSFLLPPGSDRWVFLVGVLPALMVFWIRRHVPAPETWQRAGAATAKKPGALDLFRGAARSVTVRTSVVCAPGLSAWWLLLFWQTQHLRKLLAAARTPAAETTQLVSAAFFAFNIASIVGNFAGGGLARRFRYRRAIAFMFVGLAASIFGAFVVPREFASLAGSGCRSADFSVASSGSSRCIRHRFSRSSSAPPAPAFATTSAVSPPRLPPWFSAGSSRSATFAARSSASAPLRSPPPFARGGYPGPRRRPLRPPARRT